MGKGKAQKRKEKDEARAARKAREAVMKRPPVELRPVSRTVGIAPPQTSTNMADLPPTTITPPHREPSLHPTSTEEAEDPKRGRSQQRSSSGEPEEHSISPPPTPKRKRAREVSGLNDEQICKRYRQLRDTIISMEKASDTRRVISDLENYHEAARLIPRVVHPFINVHEALTFGLTYREGDFDWDAADDDDEDEELNSDNEDDEESPKAIRARELAHKRELFYQYNALINTLPDLKTDIHLLDDDEIESLADYVQKDCAKARSTDSSHVVRTLLTYMNATNDNPAANAPKLPAILPKALRGYGNYHTAQALIPPNFLRSFEEDWERVCEMILKKEIHIPAEDWPSFLFDIDIYAEAGDDAGMEALLRSPLFKMIYKSLWTGQISVTMAGGRPDKVSGKSPIGVHYELKEVTPRTLAYTAVLTREALTTHDWSIMDLDFNNREFFDGLVALFAEPMTPWAKETMEWWNSEVYGNLSAKATRKLTKGRKTMAQMIRGSIKVRNARKAGKAVARPSSSPAPKDPPPEEEEGMDDVADNTGSSGSGSGASGLGSGPSDSSSSSSSSDND